MQSRLIQLIIIVLLSSCTKPTTLPQQPATQLFASPTTNSKKECNQDIEQIGNEFSVQCLKPLVYKITQNKPVSSNLLLVEMPDQTLVLVSTPWTTAATRRFLTWIHSQFGQDRKMIAINPHFHFDSSGGNEALREAGIPIYASRDTARLLLERGESMKEDLAQMFQDSPELVIELRSMKPTAATELFDSEKGMNLTFGNEHVQMMYPGPAHSPDNVVVYFPEQRVLFGTCMVVGMPKMGYLGVANLTTWPSALEKLRSLNAEIIIPGHGERTDPGLLDHTLQLVHDSVNHQP